MIYGSKGRVLVRAQGGRLIWTSATTEPNWLKSDFIFSDEEAESAIQKLGDAIETPARKQPCVLEGGKIKLVGNEIRLEK